MRDLLRRIKKSIGPGVITGVADDDPSGIATYAQTGAVFGLSQLWLTLYSLPFMVAVQEMCARIGMVTGNGLAGIIKKNYPKFIVILAVTLLGVANIVNIGADLGAMGVATDMISSLSFGVSLIIITLLTLFAAVYVSYKMYARILKYLAATVLSYVVAAFFINHDWKDVFYNAFIPHLKWDKDFLLNVTAFLGTTISPYLFFWQTAEEVEEQIEHKKITDFGKGRAVVTKAEIKQMRADTFAGMFLSNAVAFFIILTAYGTLPPGSEVTSATQLAEALRPLAGDFAVYLFAFGILGTGLLAVPILAGSFAYAIAETFDLKAGLGKKLKEAIGFYAVIVIATLVGVLLNFVDINPIQMLYYAAAVNGILAAPILVIILFIANNKKIMGDQTNSVLSNVLVSIITVIMAIISIFTIEGFLR